MDYGLSLITVTACTNQSLYSEKRLGSSYSQALLVTILLYFSLPSENIQNEGIYTLR